MLPIQTLTMGRNVVNVFKNPGVWPPELERGYQSDQNM